MIRAPAMLFQRASSSRASKASMTGAVFAWGMPWPPRRCDSEGRVSILRRWSAPMKMSATLSNKI